MKLYLKNGKYIQVSIWSFWKCELLVKLLVYSIIGLTWAMFLLMDYLEG